MYEITIADTLQLHGRTSLVLSTNAPVASSASQPAASRSHAPAVPLLLTSNGTGSASTLSTSHEAR